MTASSNWLEVREKGAVFGIRWMVFLGTTLGRGTARAFVSFIALYYVLVHGSVRRTCRDFLTRVQGRATFGMIYQHVLRFAHCAVDRLFLLRGRTDLFQVTSHGTEHLRDTQNAGRGAILLGAHIGSFEAMRALARDRQYRINIVGYFRNARMINAALEALDPNSRARVIHVDPDGPTFVLQVRELVEKGEFVAILADRTGLGGKTVDADFLGSRVKFPAGPYVLASVLRCPVFLTFGLFHEPDRYDLYCEPFADPLLLDRRRRAEDLAMWAGRYASRLEHYVRLAPDNWFNFYDYWAQS